jgi:NADH-quinone oxidoreductase subunit M
MGLPTTNGFIGELLVLIGAYKASWAFGVLAVIGVLLGAVYLLRMFQKVFLGEFSYHGKEALKDLNLRELVAAVPLLAMVFWIGLYPKSIISVMDAPLRNIAAQFEENLKKGEAAVLNAPGPADKAIEALAKASFVNDDKDSVEGKASED